MIEGLKVKRTHHYLSDVEYGYHLLAEFSPDVIDIREQYALLPREETLEIANHLGVKHPVYKETGALRVMTSDLVLTMRPEIHPPYTIISCKVVSDLDPALPESRRTIEKLLIEKIYWSRRNARWILGTEKMLPANKIANLDFFRCAMVSGELDFLNALLGRFIVEFRAAWQAHHTMNDLLKVLAKKMDISTEHTFTLLGRAAWSRLLEFDLHSARFAHESPMLFRCVSYGDDSNHSTRDALV